MTYARGETPVPCIRCNETVKFRDLLGMASDLGADALATGHYARRVDGPDGPELHRAVDTRATKAISSLHHARAIGFSALSVGRHAQERDPRAGAALDLPVAKSPTARISASCPPAPTAIWSTKLRPERPAGRDRRRAGRSRSHDGIIHFTVGQRKGLGVAGGEPLYVLRLEPETRRVVVGPRDALGRRRVAMGEVNWLGAAPPAAAMRGAVKLRSAQPPQAATSRSRRAAA